MRSLARRFLIVIISSSSGWLHGSEAEVKIVREVGPRLGVCREIDPLHSTRHVRLPWPVGWLIMCGVWANCSVTKWLLHPGSRQDDAGGHRSRQSCRPSSSTLLLVLGLCSVCVRGSYTQPPFSVARPPFRNVTEK